jgi:hypothetical protein
LAGMGRYDTTTFNVVQMQWLEEELLRLLA